MYDVPNVQISELCPKNARFGGLHDIKPATSRLLCILSTLALMYTSIQTLSNVTSCKQMKHNTIQFGLTTDIALVSNSLKYDVNESFYHVNESLTQKNGMSMNLLPEFNAYFCKIGASLGGMRERVVYNILLLLI